MGKRFFGSGPGGNRRGRSVVEKRGNLYVRPYVHTSAHPSPPAPPKLAQASQRLVQASQSQAQASQSRPQASQSWAQASQSWACELRWTDGRTGGRRDRRTDSPCILQDFVPSSSLQGRCPAYIIAIITKYQSRAGVPMTISCLWGTGSLMAHVQYK